MERIPEQNNLMLDELQCKEYNDSFKTHEHELKAYIELYKDVIGITSGNIIDLGSGSCNFVIALCLAFPDLNVTCYEMSDIMVTLANKNIKNNKLSNRITVIKDDILNATGKYDAVLVNRVLHHVDDTYRFWKLITELSDKVLLSDLERFENENDLNHLSNFIKNILSPFFFEDTISSFKAAYNLSEVTEQIKNYNLVATSIKVNPVMDIKYSKLLVHHNK